MLVSLSVTPTYFMPGSGVSYSPVATEFLYAMSVALRRSPDSSPERVALSPIVNGFGFAAPDEDAVAVVLTMVVPQPASDSSTTIRPRMLHDWIFPRCLRYTLPPHRFDLRREPTGFRLTTLAGSQEHALATRPTRSRVRQSNPGGLIGRRCGAADYSTPSFAAIRASRPSRLRRVSSRSSSRRSGDVSAASSA